MIAKGVSGVPVHAVDVDAAFDRLEQLYAELPAMEALAERLERSRNAAAITAAAEEHRTHQALLAAAEEGERCARAALEAAQEGEAGASETRVDELRRAAVYAGSLKGYRIGPERHARHRLESVLAESPFSTVAEATEALLDATQMMALEQQLASYRTQYAEALAACQALSPDA